MVGWLVGWLVELRDCLDNHDFLLLYWWLLLLVEVLVVRKLCGFVAVAKWFFFSKCYRVC